MVSVTMPLNTAFNDLLAIELLLGRITPSAKRLCRRPSNHVS
jgi:hypothetical protein